MTAYFISGLGADQRAFQRIVLPSSIIIKHISWVDPLKNESLQQYTKRIAEQIDTTQEFILVGLSFGGIIAIELSKILHPKKIILISSITRRKQLPLGYKIIGFLRLNLLIPGSFLKNPNFLVYRLFGVHKSRDKELLKEILRDSSPKYLYWAINQILHWKNQYTPPNLALIHGKNDRILPAKGVKPDKIITGAGHFMVYTHANQVNKFLAEIVG